jgi:hypothetical protein
MGDLWEKVQSQQATPREPGNVASYSPQDTLSDPPREWIVYLTYPTQAKIRQSLLAMILPQIHLR